MPIATLEKKRSMLPPRAATPLKH